MIRKRIQIYADPETKRRIELAAAKHDLAVTEYCLAAIEQQLAEDDVLEQELVHIPIRQTKAPRLYDDLHRFREHVLARRHGAMRDVVAAVEQSRDERDDEIDHVVRLR